MTIVLQRITTEYCADEDRIRLTGAPEQGTPLVFWLTQRLLRRLLPLMLRWLEQDRAVAPAVPAAPAPSVAQAMQEFAQQAAYAAWQPLPPVQVAAGPGAQGWLVASVDVLPGAVALQLQFHDGAGHDASLLMEAVPLRQWLTVLHARCREAEWLLDWPAWLDGLAAATPQTGLALH